MRERPSSPGRRQLSLQHLVDQSRCPLFAGALRARTSGSAARGGSPRGPQLLLLVRDEPRSGAVQKLSPSSPGSELLARRGGLLLRWMGWALGVGPSDAPPGAPDWLRPKAGEVRKVEAWLGLQLLPGCVDLLLLRRGLRPDKPELQRWQCRRGSWMVVQRGLPRPGELEACLARLAGPTGRWAVYLESDEALAWRVLLGGADPGLDCVLLPDQGPVASCGDGGRMPQHDEDIGIFNCLP